MSTKKPDTSTGKPGEVKVVDTKKAMAALDKIRKRDAELLRRLAR